MTNKKFISKLFLGFLLLGLSVGLPNSVVAAPPLQGLSANSPYAAGNVPEGYHNPRSRSRAGEMIRQIDQAQQAQGENYRGPTMRPLTETELNERREDGRKLAAQHNGGEASMRDAEQILIDNNRTLSNRQAVKSVGLDLFRGSQRLEKQVEIASDYLAYGEQWVARATASGDANDLQRATTFRDTSRAGYEQLSNALKGQGMVRESRKDDMNAFTTTDPVTGKPTTVYVNSSLKAKAGVMKGCMPINVKLAQAKQCIFCPLFLILFNSAQAISKASYEELSAGFGNLLLIGFALYLAYVSLRQVSAFTKQDGPKFITETLTLTFKVLLAYVILMNVSQLYKLVLSPVLGAGIEFGNEFLFRGQETNVLGTNSSFDGCVNSSITDSETLGTMNGAKLADGYYEPSLYAKIDCFVRSVQKEIAISQSIGSSLMCVSQHSAAHTLFPDVTMMLTGVIIWLFAWLLMLAFAFYLFDSVVRLAVIGGIMPFLIVCWPFKITSGYTGKGWAMFMNAFFTFVFLGLVVTINLQLASVAATGGDGDLSTIIDLMNRDAVNEILDVMSIGLGGILFLILCCLFGFKLTMDAIQLASQMSEAKSGHIGSNIGMAAASVGKWAGQKAAKGTWKGAKLGGKALANSAAGQATGDALKQGANATGKGIVNGAKFVGKGAVGMVSKNLANKWFGKGGQAQSSGNTVASPGGTAAKDPKVTNNINLNQEAGNDNRTQTSGANNNNSATNAGTTGGADTATATGATNNSATEQLNSQLEQSKEQLASGGVPGGSGNAEKAAAEASPRSDSGTGNGSVGVGSIEADTVKKANEMIATENANNEAANTNQTEENQGSNVNKTYANKAERDKDLSRIRNLRNQIRELKQKIEQMDTQRTGVLGSKVTTSDDGYDRLDNNMTPQEALETIEKLAKEKEKLNSMVADLQAKQGQ